ncbi:uncharacterized protein LOC133850367 [Drosophila sulfurigaster albostrigata]|uniref:uncharacterized protein LOC133850367 n=1 Tax=Drosophila sulfurigaster albostrigata TaxID=89887 RepID=UPI002D21A565|nr:uncharacterized protein LOC133850367 [Drosophila sulfurigaster albostrigata]
MLCSRRELCIQLLVAALIISSYCTGKIVLDMEQSRPQDMEDYCRTLDRLQAEYEQRNCAQILAEEEELTMTSELLMDTDQRCWWGWELFGRRCRKRV